MVKQAYSISERRHDEMRDWLAVLIGGMVGGGLRYEFSQWWGSVPATTLVNLVGAFALAWLTTDLINRHSAP